MDRDDTVTKLDWMAVFPDRKSPIKTAKVRLIVPEVLAGKLTKVDSNGVTAKYQKVDERTFNFVISQELLPQQSLQIRAEWPQSILNLDSSSSQNNESPNWIFWGALLFLGFLSMAGSNTSDDSGDSGDSGDGGGCAGCI